MVVEVQSTKTWKLEISELCQDRPVEPSPKFHIVAGKPCPKLRSVVGRTIKILFHPVNPV